MNPRQGERPSARLARLARSGGHDIAVQSNNEESKAEIERAREADRAGRRINVLVTVKATPQLSRTYGDTVCVAGIALNPLRLVRLYPVPFRYLDGSQQFKKYDLISVRVRNAGSDGRPESLKLDAGSVEIYDHLDKWSTRAPYVEPLVGGSLCQLQRLARSDLNAPSLAIVPPAQVSRLEISKHAGWTPEQRHRFEVYAQQGDLLREAEPHILEAPRLEARLVFRCNEAACAGAHRVKIIDWELTALQRRYSRASDAEVERVVREKFLTQMFASRRAPAIFLGNQEAVTRRQQYMALGVYYPKAADAASPLF